MITRRLLLGAGAALSLGPRARAAEPADPLQSISWAEMREQFLGGGPVVFDDGVALSAPSSAEDALQVPFLADAGKLGPVTRLVAFADLNPIPLILDYRPGALAPLIAARFKIQQATPLRVAALDARGLWHVAGQWVDAMGGGCTAPALAHGTDDWTAHLGESEARVFARDGRRRLRVSFRHPMDTGLAAGIPAFFIERVTVEKPDGSLLGALETFEPVSENPLLTVELPAALALPAVVIRARDNNGNVFRRPVTL
ncbi:quinoprotein dehydrogenase-associated SoxYZ-like carrier [Zavarzinia compransoris]|uniref:Quinoprotein dehydrogenase-associated SoxYZ-like carrier n=1 Tax=Zavarzinia compransoris TaxID=1264899 RepID=A0A317DVZ0_9PROT|nr:quinoprotein dehydrogenase-associated SoxYZ-like carrier [Zavarzinia compransoris]PWR18701.1 quinoprotein dehydrogenase-associated SoxYZ-like carrier [Zavarzinia compransoris]TDP48680.1 sulfur-oxidizing protein SoxY [Zavarzinia compransoris]